MGKGRKHGEISLKNESPPVFERLLVLVFAERFKVIALIKGFFTDWAAAPLYLFLDAGMFKHGFCYLIGLIPFFPSEPGQAELDRPNFRWYLPGPLIVNLALVHEHFRRIASPDHRPIRHPLAMGCPVLALGSCTNCRFGCSKALDNARLEIALQNIPILPMRLL